MQETETELVLMVFLRVVEDVIIFQSIPQQRRREIQQTLTANLGELFKFFLTKLNYHKEQYHSLVSHCFGQVNFVFIEEKTDH